MDFVMVVLSPGRPESCSKPNVFFCCTVGSQSLRRALTGTLRSETAATRVSAEKFELNWCLEVNQNYLHNQPGQDGNTLFPFHECVFYRVCWTNLFLVGRTRQILLTSIHTSISREVLKVKAGVFILLLFASLTDCTI